MGKQWTPPESDTPVQQTGWAPPATDQEVSPKKESGAGSPHDFGMGYKPSAEDIKQKNNLKTFQNNLEKPQPEKKPDKGSWGNLPVFGAREVFGGLEKDLGNLFGFAKDKLSKLPGMAGVGAGETMGAAEDYWRKAQKEDEQVSKTHPLPNTTAGHLATTVTKFVPDIIELAATPELDVAKLGKLGEYAAKLGKVGTKAAGYAVGKFPIQQGTKKMLQNYTYAKDKGLGENEANLEALKGFGEGYKDGIIFEGAGDAAGKLTKLGTDALEKAGLMSGNKLIAGAEKRLLHATAQGITFSAAPILQNAVEGKPTDLNEIKQSGIFGTVLGGLTGYHAEEGATGADKSAAQVIMRKPLVDLHNFVNADIGDIKNIHLSDATAADLQAQSAAHAEAGFKKDEQEEKAKAIIQSGLSGKASSIKSVTESILKDKDGVIDEVNQMDLPEEVKKAAIEKVNQVHKELDPTEQQKTAISDHLDKNNATLEQLKKQDGTSGDNIERDVKVADIEKQNKELTNKYTDLLKKQQNEKEKSSGGSEQVAARAGDSGSSGSEGDQNQETHAQPDREVPVDKEKEGEKGDVTPTGEATAEPVNEKPRYIIKGDEVKPKDDAIQESKTESLPIHPEANNSGGVPKEIASEGEKSQKEVKKTILTKRAYEGTISEDVKKHLEEKGLTRKSFSQEERSKQATDLINKFGDDAAFQSVNTGDVDGGLAASTLAQLQIRNSMAMSDLPMDSPEREELAKKQSDIIALMEKKGYLGGEFNGQLAHEYENAELDFANVKKQVESLTKKPLTPDQEKKVKDLTTQNEKLKAQLQESEAKLIEETDKAFKSGEEAAKNETKTQKAKRIADKLRSNGKLSRPGVFSSASPASLVWDTAVEVVAKGIETGGKLADAIDAGLKHIKESDWYKSLPQNKQILAEKEFKRFNNDNSGSTDLNDLRARFVDKSDNKFTPSEARDLWLYMKENYIGNGISYRDAMSKTADDLGLSWRQVSEAITTPKNKRISDEMWKKQAEYTRYRIAIKSWIGDQNKSVAGKALNKVSGLFRGVSVFGHGGIFIGTHAGMTVFNPSTWNKVIPAFFKGWKFAYGNEADYERSMEELQNGPNYIIAQRSGLKNNPDRMNAEEYQKSQKYLGKLGLAGERGFNAIKVLRQNLFDYHFNNLTPAERDDPEVAKSIAHIVNLATGATGIYIPSWVNEASFAGGMEAARWEKLTASPATATRTALKAIFTPGKASTADRAFAKVWSRRVGEQLATFTVVMAVNAAIQNTLNPQNPTNYTDPSKPDFMKFKFGDETIDPTSGMRSTAMFMYTIGKIPFQDKAELHNEKRIKVVGKDIAQYARGKLAPLYGTVADFFTGEDYSGNVMPYSADKPSGNAHNLTWGEYAWSKAPLPIAEAASVVYNSAIEHGADKKTLNDYLKGIQSGVISGSTGFRVGEYDASALKNDPMYKKLSTITKSDGEKITLTPAQIKQRKSFAEQALKKEGGLWKKEFEYKYKLNHREVVKREAQEKQWKTIGRSEQWIKDNQAKAKDLEYKKFIQGKIIHTSEVEMKKELLKENKPKNTFSIK